MAEPTIMAVAQHLVAHVRGFNQPSLLSPTHAAWLWQHLRQAFPEALSCVLMATHLHLVVLGLQTRRLQAVLSGYTRCFGTRFDIIQQEANSHEIAFRAVRYGILNPVFDGLVQDAWRCRYSTARDLLGAAYPVWTPVARVARALRRSPQSLLRAVTHTEKSRPPVPVPRAIRYAAPETIVDAVAATCRIPADEVLRHRDARRLTVQARRQLGAPRRRTVAEEFGLTLRAVDCLSEPRHLGLDAVLFSLSDSRLCSDSWPPERPGVGARGVAPGKRRRGV